MTKPQPDLDNWHIVVYPRSAGDFGIMSISSIRHTEQSAKDLQRRMQEDIRRHVDNVHSTRVETEFWYCGTCQSTYHTYNDADKCCEEGEEE